MPPLFRVLLLTSFTFAVLSTHTIIAADWPQWRGPDRTGHTHPSDTLPKTLPNDITPVWKVSSGEGFSSPVISAGAVYLFDNQEDFEVLRALKSSDGSEIWRFQVDSVFRDNQGPPGPRTTPVVDGDRIYAQSCKGTFVCLNTKDGSLIWNLDFEEDYDVQFIGEKGNAPGATRHGNTGAPAIWNDMIFVSVGSTNNAGMVCLNKHTGRQIWRSGNEIAAYAAPMVVPIGNSHQVINFMADALIGFDALTGKQLWRYPIRTAFARHVTTPIIHGNRVIVASHQHGLFAVELKHHPDTDSWTATEDWKTPDASMNFSSPIAVGKTVYGLGPKRNIVSVDMETGSILWSQDGWVGTSPDKAHAGFLSDGNLALTLSDSGELFLWKPSPDSCQELARVQVCGMNWCNPAYSDGRLYVRDGIRGKGDLLCIDLKPRP